MAEFCILPAENSNIPAALYERYFGSFRGTYIIFNRYDHAFLNIYSRMPYFYMEQRCLSAYTNVLRYVTYKDFPLFFAILNNDLSAVTRLATSQHQALNVTHEMTGISPLGLALTLNHIDVARTLLKHNANPNFGSGRHHVMLLAIDDIIFDGEQNGLPHAIAKLALLKEFGASMNYDSLVKELKGKTSAPGFFVMRKCLPDKNGNIGVAKYRSDDVKRFFTLFKETDYMPSDFDKQILKDLRSIEKLSKPAKQCVHLFEDLVQSQNAKLHR